MVNSSSPEKIISVTSNGDNSKQVRELTKVSGYLEYKDCEGIELIASNYRINEIKSGLSQLRNIIPSKNLDSSNLIEARVKNNQL